MRRIVLAALLLGSPLLGQPAAPAGQTSALAPLNALYPELDALYVDLHQTPELSLHEEKTS